MEKTSNPAWIRIAGNAANIKAGLRSHWRCYIGRELPLIPLEDWRVSGTTTPQNFIPGTSPAGDHLKLTAWIDVYGLLSVDDDGVAMVELKDHPEATE